MIYAQLRGTAFDPKITYRAVGRAMEFWLDTEADLNELRNLYPEPTENVGGGSIAICCDTKVNYVLMTNGWQVL